MKRSSLLPIALVFANVSAASQPGDPFKPGKLPPAEQAALQQGLTLRFYADNKPIDARRVRLAALHVPNNSPPSPFIAPGPFHAKLTGYLKNPLKGSYSFRLHGTGTMALRINEKDVLGKPDQAVEVELAKNYNRIEIIYASPKNGDATFRLYWSGEKFDFEPVPPDVLFSRGDEADLIEKSALREGRQLFASLNCVYCHQPVNSVSMPELRRNRVEAPRLDQFGDRFQPDWVAAWILNPRAVRPEATMPRVFHLVGDEKNASDIAAFLISQKREDLNALAKSPNAANGQAIYKKLGCGTCHRLDHPGAKDELDRLSLHFVGAKFAPHAIGHFLKEPHKRYPWTRMPDFKLSDDEAAHLEAFLRQNAKGTIDARPLGNAGTGKKLFSQSCSACHTDTPMEIHDVGGIKKLTIPIRSLDKGCLAAKDQGKGLDFGLNAHQRNALTAFVKTDGVSLTRETPAEFSQRQVRALQCNSCHRRDGDITRWHAVLEVEGKEPEKLPSMTWIGEKLKPAWTQKLLAGQHDHSARPWIKARMPAFPARAEMLAVGLSHEHGFGIDDDERPKPDAKLAAIGEKLVPQQGGFKCNDCHAIGKTPATQPFEVEARGINLLDAALRLRYSYYQRWMMVPDRVDVTMRMPVFSSDGKTTQLREVFDGDARKQYDALWHYIQTLPTR